MSNQYPKDLPTISQLKPLISKFQNPEWGPALIQLASSLLPYMALWALMVVSLRYSYVLTLALAIPAAGFLVRIFIIFHDCGHNSFFPSNKANKTIGFWLGVLVFTPGEQWWHSHAIHHATSSNLDRRGVGDVQTLTVEEYRSLPALKRLGYRLFRHPLVMFILGPIWMFLISHRLPSPRFGQKETLSVIYHNLALLAMIAGISQVISWRSYLMIQLPVIWLAGMAGIWLFYLQHQFERVYWSRNDQWNYVSSALLGASFYKLPRLLKWFSGNIGYHHIHHLSPRIPSYQLDRCYESNPLLQEMARKITLRSGFQNTRLALWDENQQRMVSFSEAEI
jgi:omega-6 fatty acid desaturase (delta-12 desaturase)